MSLYRVLVIILSGIAFRQERGTKNVLAGVLHNFVPARACWGPVARAFMDDDMSQDVGDMKTCEKESQTERRKFKRFKVRDEAYAMVTPLSEKRGEIIDISRGGLALQYVVQEGHAEVASEIDLYLHIFLKDISFCLLRIPIQTVSDFEIAPEDASGTLRRRSVVFGSLSKNQMNDLEHFIEKHTLH
jgi:hypothetical protein